jgi:hypothetical protein
VKDGRKVGSGDVPARLSGHEQAETEAVTAQQELIAIRQAVSFARGKDSSPSLSTVIIREPSLDPNRPGNDPKQMTRWAGLRK